MLTNSLSKPSVRVVIIWISVGIHSIVTLMITSGTIIMIGFHFWRYEFRATLQTAIVGRNFVRGTPWVTAFRFIVYMHCVLMAFFALIKLALLIVFIIIIIIIILLITIPYPIIRIPSPVSKLIILRPLYLSLARQATVSWLPLIFIVFVLIHLKICLASNILITRKLN